MQTKLTAVSAVLLVTGVAAASAASASDWSGSYAADGSCYCTGVLAGRVSNTLVPTPVGSQTVGSVCERVGTGPVLMESGGQFNHVVYPDPQCGNGPFDAIVEKVSAACPGTREPGSDDCHAAGPRWDLAKAYSRPAPAVALASTAERDPEPLAAAMPAATVAPQPARTVTVDGQQWREAPPGTDPLGGDAGSRIILDGTLWLKADDPLFSITATRATAASKPRALEQSTMVQATAPESVAPVVVKGSEPQLGLADRQRILVAQARERARQRKEARLAASASRMPSTPVEDVAVSAQAEQNVEAPEIQAPVVETVVTVDAPAPVVPDEDVSVEVVAESVATDEGSTGASSLSAFRLPVDARPSSRDYSFVQAMPVSFDIGGGGVALAGSAEFKERFHLVIRGAAVNKYSELMVGGGYHYTPPAADRMTLFVTTGIEYGVFPISNESIAIDASDAGLYIGTGSRLVVNRRFELEAGVAYSSFHEGDPNLFGGAYFHINRNVDLISAFELGDNDSFGVGLRVYY